MKKNKAEDIIEEIEEEVEEEVVSPKQKKSESIEKRKKAKKKDAIARWGGIIFLVLVLMVGLLLWVGGEMGSQPSGMQVPVPKASPVLWNETPNSRIIIE